jgi:four helix bundle protein
MIKGFQDLEVWQKAQELVLQIYKRTNSFPRSEQFGIVSEIHCAAYSIPANLAEGRRSTNEFLQFLGFANGSAEGLRYFVILSKDKDLRYISPRDGTRLTSEITGIVQMMAALTRSLRARSKELEVFSRVVGHGSRDTKPSAEVRH